MYGVDCVEGLVSLLVTLHLITEMVVEKTAEAIRYWLSTNVASEIRMGNWVCLLKKQRRECMDSRSVGWGRK